MEFILYYIYSAFIDIYILLTLLCGTYIEEITALIQNDLFVMYILRNMCQRNLSILSACELNYLIDVLHAEHI